MSSLLQMIQLTESDQLGERRNFLSSYLLSHLDRVWIEKMLYRLESKPPHIWHKMDLTRRIEQLVSEAAAAGYPAVFIGEVDYLRPMLQISAFPNLPRPPRVNEIYRLQNSYVTNKIWNIEYLGTFTPRNFTGQEAE